jgi:hypothetical protein
MVDIHPMLGDVAGHPEITCTDADTYDAAEFEDDICAGFISFMDGRKASFDGAVARRFEVNLGPILIGLGAAIQVAANDVGPAPVKLEAELDVGKRLSRSR